MAFAFENSECDVDSPQLALLTYSLKEFVSPFYSDYEVSLFEEIHYAEWDSTPKILHNGLSAIYKETILNCKNYRDQRDEYVAELTAKNMFLHKLHCDYIRATEIDNKINRFCEFYDSIKNLVLTSQADTIINEPQPWYEAMKDKFFDLVNFDQFKDLDNITIANFTNILEDMKPINLANLLGQFASCETAGEKIGVMSAIAELYDMFWKTNNPVKLLIIEAFSSITSFIIKSCWTPDDEDDVQMLDLTLESQAKIAWSEDCCLNKMLKYCHLDPITEFSDTGGKILGAIMALLLLVTGGTITNFCSTTTTSLIKRVNKFATATKSVVNLVDYLPKLWTFMLTSVGKIFGFTVQDTEDVDVQAFLAKLMEFKTESYELLAKIQHAPHLITLHEDNMLKINNRMTELDALYFTLIKAKKNLAATKVVFDDVKKAVHTLDGYAQALKNSSVRKIEPFFLLLSGDAGIGKSECVAYIVEQLGTRLGYPLTTFTRNSASAYWDQYCHQHIVMYDDWGTSKLDTDHNDLMLVKNPNRTSLTMAIAEEKGRQFSSIGIIACSNTVDVTASASIKNIDALKRRIEMPIYVHDPNYEAFVAEHGCSPGKYEKEHKSDPDPAARIAMVTGENGQQIPYFTRDFSHLQFLLLPASDAAGMPIKEMTATQVVDMAHSYHQFYLDQYNATFAIPDTANAVFDDNTTDDTATVTTDSSRKSDTLDDLTFMLRQKKLIDVKATVAPSGIERLVKKGNLDENHFLNTGETRAIPTGPGGRPLRRRTPVTDVKGIPRPVNAPPAIPRCPRQVKEAAFTESEPEIIQPPIGAEVDLEALIATHVHQDVEENMDVARMINNLAESIPGVAQLPALLHSIADLTLDSQSKEEVDSSAAAFHQFEQGKGRIFAFTGPPGTGKSTIANKIMALLGDQVEKIHSSRLAGFIPTKPILVIEDVTSSDEGFALSDSLITAIYDGESTVQFCMVSYNEDILRVRTKDSVELLRKFERRMTKYAFRFSTKKSSCFLFKKYYTAEDVEEEISPYGSMVSIKEVHSGTIMTVDAVIAKIKTQCLTEMRTFSEVMTVCVPYICKDDYIPNFIVEFKEPLVDAFKTLYEDPQKIISWLNPLKPKVKLLKGTFSDGVTVAGQFSNTSGPRPVWPGDLKNFILMVNNSGFRSAVPFITEFKGPDGAVVIMPRKNIPNILRMFHVTSDVLEITPTGVMTDGENTAPTSFAVRNEYSEIKNTISLVSQDIAEKVENFDLFESLGLNVLFEMHPWIKKITQILLFVFRMGLAAFSITSLLQMHKKAFLRGFSMSSEAKGKNKIKRRFGTHVYEGVRRYVRENGSASAQRYSARTLIAMYEDMCEFTTLEYHTDPGFQCFLSTFVSESRELQPKEVNRPNVDTMPGLVAVESREMQPKEVLRPNVDTMPGLVAVEAKKKKIKTPKPFVPTKESLEDTVAPNMFQSEALLDPQAKAYVNMCAKNTVEIGQEVGGKFERAVYGLMIAEKIGATVNHVRQFVEGEMKCRVFNSTGYHVYPVSILGAAKKNDLLVFKIESPSCPMYTSLIHLMPSSKENFNQHVANREGFLVTCERNGLSVNNLIRNVRLDARQEVKTTTGDIEALRYFGVISGLQTRGAVTTDSGDCGSAIIVNDPSAKYRIVGIHNSANQFVGAGSILFRDFFEQFLVLKSESARPVTIPLKVHEIDLLDMSDKSLMGMTVAGTSDLSVRIPRKSHLWNSPLRMEGALPFEPAILDPNDVRNSTNEDPYYRSVQKWNHAQPSLNTEVLDRAVDDISYWYASVIKSRGITTKVLTKTEAINAGKNFNVMPINRGSSPGFPWNKYYRTKGDFFVNKGSKQEAYYGINLESVPGQRLNNAIDQMIDISRVPGQHPSALFFGSLKDEPVGLKKIYDVNTRSFAGSGVDYTIVYRMYYSTLMGAVHSVRDAMPIQIGIDPTSLEIDHLVRRMLAVSPNGTDLDFKSFDSTVPAEVTRRLPVFWNTIARFTDPNFSEEDAMIRKNIHDSLVKPLLVVPLDGQTYILQAPGGQVSGNPGTADDNSVIHLIYLYYAYLLIMVANGKSDFANMETFKTYVNGIIYGDDGAYAIHPEISDVFNFVSIQKVMTEMNITCTPASKLGVIAPLIPVLDFEFLKREFVFFGAKYYGRLKDNSIRKMLGYCLGPLHNWDVDKTNTALRVDDLIQTARAALREAVFHGDKYYVDLSMHLDRKFMLMGIPFVCPRRRDMISLLGVPM